MSMYSYYIFMYLHGASWQSLAILTEVFLCLSSIVRQMRGYNPQRRCTARTLPKFLCSSIYIYIYIYIVCFVSFCLLFLCKCVLYYCHRVATQLQLTNLSPYQVKSMLRSVWFELREIDGDWVCTLKSRYVRERARTCRWEYWPYLFGVGNETVGLCIAGSCPAALGIILVSTASGWTVVMLNNEGSYYWHTLIMDHFAQHVRKYEMAGCTLEEVDRKSCSVFGVLIFAIK